MNRGSNFFQVRCYQHAHRSFSGSCLFTLDSEHAHVLSQSEAPQSIPVCRLPSLWPKIRGRWADRALELPRGKSTAPCHLSSPWHCACWNQTTSPIQMRHYIRCWINEWWNLDRLKWKKKKVSEAICPSRLYCRGSVDGSERGEEERTLRTSLRYVAHTRLSALKWH